MRPMAEKKTMILTIRVEESLAKALKSLAEADERKLSAYAARVLRRHAEERGALSEAKTKKRG
jgi:predicted transcriptional regulator